MRRWLWLFAAVLGCGGGPSSKPPPTARPIAIPTPLPEGHAAAPVAGELALLRYEAHIATDVATSASRARLAKDSDPERTWLFRVLAVDGEVVVVENVLADTGDGLCQPDVPDRLEAFRLRLFVRRSDLVPVTREATDTRFPDGSGIALAAGMPLRGALTRAGDRFRARVLRGEISYDVEVPAAAVGLSFAKGGDVDPGELDARIGEKVPVRYGADLETRSNEDRRVGRERLSGGRMLVRTGDRCVVARGWVDAASLHDDVLAELSASTGGGWGEGCSHGSSAGANVKVFWPDGRDAGETLETIALCHARAGGAAGLRCFDWRLTYDGKDSALPICFRPGDLK